MESGERTSGRLNHFSYVNPRVDNSKQEARETYQFTLCTRTHAWISTLFSVIRQRCLVQIPIEFRSERLPSSSMQEPIIKMGSFLSRLCLHPLIGISFRGLSFFLPLCSLFLEESSKNQIDRSCPTDNKEKGKEKNLIPRNKCSTMKGSRELSFFLPRQIRIKIFNRVFNDLMGCRLHGKGID